MNSKYPESVTNAFRPVVVLLLETESEALDWLQESPMPFGLLWCCYTCNRKHGQARLQSPMPFGLLWCCYRITLKRLFIAAAVTNAFRPVVVLLRCFLLALFVRARHQCLSACCGVVTRTVAVEVMESSGSHQCLSACCGVVTLGHFYARIERVQRTKRMGALFVLFPRHVEEGLMHRNPRKTGRNDRDGTPPILADFWSGPEFDGPVVRDHTR